MKLNNFLIGASAFLTLGAMASCSSEVDVNNSIPSEQAGEKYIAVRLTNTSAGTRATEDQNPVGDGYEAGVGTENNITAANTRFYFFTDQYQPFLLSSSNINGEVSPSNMVTPQELNQFNQDGNQSSTLNGVLVLGKPDGPYIGKVPKYVVCAANLSDAEFEQLKNKSLRQLYDATVRMGDPANVGFKMVTSTYLKSNPSNTDGSMDRVICSMIAPESVCSNVTDAQKKPVDIYLERQMVKVRTTGLKVYPAENKNRPETATVENEFYFVQADGTTVKKELYVDLTGWQLRNTTNYARMFKNISKTVNYFDGWNQPDYHRSLWAITPSTAELEGNGYILNTIYDIYDANQFKLKNFDSTAPTKEIAYTYPNTSYSGYVVDQDFNEAIEHPKSITDKETGATAVVIRGVVQTKNADGTYTPLNCVRWAGSLYETNVFKQMVAKQYDIEHENPAGTTKIEDVSFTEKSAGTLSNHYVASIKNTIYTRFDNVEEWKNGVTCFYVNIKHATNPSGQAMYGVVRNHIYEHEVTGVVGLGVPGNDTKNPVDEEESYVACRLNVLNWGLVRNQIVLE